jgi:prepilin-type N-terminal cleavage/methylation domain-containing protein
MNKKGFTLLEIMLVVIIVGVLSALALPRMFMVIERARLAEGVAIAGRLRRAMNEHYHLHGDWPNLGNSGVAASSIPGLDVGYDETEYFYNIRVYNRTYHGRHLIGELYRRPNPDYTYHIHIYEDGYECSSSPSSTCSKFGMTHEW